MEGQDALHQSVDKSWRLTQPYPRLGSCLVKTRSLRKVGLRTMRSSAFNLAGACFGPALLAACGGGNSVSDAPSQEAGTTRSSAANPAFLAPRNTTGSATFN